MHDENVHGANSQLQAQLSAAIFHATILHSKLSWFSLCVCVAGVGNATEGGSQVLTHEGVHAVNLAESVTQLLKLGAEDVQCQIAGGCSVGTRSSDAD